MTKYRVNDCFKYDYSEIGEYVDENHTDKPLRNDKLCNLLNEQNDLINTLREELELADKENTILNQENLELIGKNSSLIITVNKQEKQLNAFKNLAKDYNLTLDILYEVCKEYLDKLDDEEVIE